MNLIDENIAKKIFNKIVYPAQKGKYSEAAQNISGIIKSLYANIPDQKRISYGRVYTVKILSRHLFDQFKKNDLPIFEIAANVYNHGGNYQILGAAIGILSIHGLTDFKSVLPYFESAGKSSQWDVREMAQMFFRKLIKKYPKESREFLLRLAESEDANTRRFVSETLRPVQENRWFFENHEYPLSIIKKMFKEKSPYPRTSVGNNLSDLSRRLPGLIYGLVEELVSTGDKNSYWIAYRACRNLVKNEPVKVLDLLKIDEYKYKKRIHKRSEYQGNSS
ncbi:hypothetical protein B6I21_05085 [candidate division KSB1 bacterium 4572_119]|nr:MAG: hypothetical protein B6I21_05085 [candidate division KSB1 bacterium 4572_119]